jgi:hypothetical protein
MDTPPVPTARFANADHSAVRFNAGDGSDDMALLADDPRLSGLTVEPYVAPVPSAVTPLQARRALRAAGYLAQVEAAIATADDDTQDAWRYAQLIERAHPFLTAIAAQLGLTEAQMDDLFRAAAAG